MPCAVMPPARVARAYQRPRSALLYQGYQGQKPTLFKELYPLPPNTLYATSRPPRRPLEGILARLRGDGLPIRDMFLCCVRCPGLPKFSPVSVSPALLILTLLPLPFAWHLPIDRGLYILYRSSEERNTPIPTRRKHSMPGEVHNRCPAPGLINLRPRGVGEAF